MGEEAVVDDFDKAFAEVAAQAERTPEQIEADTKAAEEAAAKAARDAETPEAKLAREATEKATADAEAKAKSDADAVAAAAALAAEIPEAKLAREAAEKATADAEAKTKADADAAAERTKAEAEAAAKAKADADAAAAAAAETPEAKAARAKFEESIKPYEPSAEEKAAMEKFKVDFPNEAVAIEARLKGVDREINSRIFAAVQNIVKSVNPRLDAVESTTVNEAAERHFAALKAAHADYDTVIAKVPDWIKTQPAYLQPAMQAVYDGGTTSDVLSLVSDYKKAAGIGAPDAAAAAAKAKAAADAAAVAKAKTAADAAALEPVGTRRTTAGPKGKADSNDYDGAWAELAEAAK